MPCAHRWQSESSTVSERLKKPGLHSHASLRCCAPSRRVASAGHCTQRSVLLSVSFVREGAHATHWAPTCSYPGSHRQAPALVLAAASVCAWAGHGVHAPSPPAGLKLAVPHAVQTPVRSKPGAHAHCATPVRPPSAESVLGAGHCVHAALEPSWKWFGGQARRPCAAVASKPAGARRSPGHAVADAPAAPPLSHA